MPALRCVALVQHCLPDVVIIIIDKFLVDRLFFLSSLVFSTVNLSDSAQISSSQQLSTDLYATRRKIVIA